ncbi:BlaI/MecI/CopY family transcriptional regulator [Anaerotignum lactatifermentans]|uniref:BlaI/MecI/CopY family transcriptional regulator n=1 Tax=Anaerotignum lactatifermentans TaxID=160404 RepID=A0ABS2G6H8_9FIRM|nr:BlaI/MecI/CopY family transcriptional regulator [Anaerotignum lactatifermentans]MBM6828734.1 BlaI/MecI/CopY family transcriptional regulator [Anaerotignum lactatifermentans]MBM6877061.1 BlaI/MecI/CopY family transcriptional regulator [Anaerotignum lactatifermentans]MBM6950316.1 BlaI/MecI/CopY family transcriptional regulator [Anaerotignum lactatifermentans]
MGYQLTEAEERLAELLWENVPMTSAELVAKCAEAFAWKKSTTYTMLKKLERKGIFRNESSVITAVETKEEWQARESRQFVAESFGGSLPKFLTAFAKGKGLTKKEAEELRKLIERYEEE